jgi:hypothetical protein
MRARHWLGLIGLCLALAFVSVEPSQGQTQGSGLFPIGRPFTFASGFSGPVQNVPIDTTNTIVVVPQQNTGMIMSNFRKLMVPPNTNVIHGVSALPTPASMPGASFFNNLNPFGTNK